MGSPNMNVQAPCVVLDDLFDIPGAFDKKLLNGTVDDNREYVVYAQRALGDRVNVVADANAC